MSWAAWNGHREVVERLLQAGAEVDARDKKWGQTPLTLVAQNGHREVVERLLHAKAEVDATDDDGRTPLSLAARNGHREVIERLEVWKRDHV